MGVYIWIFCESFINIHSQKQDFTFFKVKLSQLVHINFHIFSLRRGDDWRVIKKSSTFWDYICNFFIIACDKHITSIIVLLVNSWLDLTDWLYLHCNKKIRCRAWANFSNYIFPLTIILFLLKTGGLIVKLINPMFLSGNEWIADIEPNFSIASISLFPTFLRMTIGWTAISNLSSQQPSH